AFRQEQLQSYLERRLANPPRFSSAELAQQMSRGMERPDPRWLSGMLAFYAPSQFRPGLPLLNRGIQDLLKRDWARVQDERIAIAPISPVAIGTPCPNCGKNIPAGARFCPSCGSLAVVAKPAVCEVCQTPVVAGAKFCLSCGHRLDSEPVVREAVRSVRPGA